MRPPVGSYGDLSPCQEQVTAPLFLSMEKFLIADLVVQMNCQFPLLKKRSRQFLLPENDKRKTDMTVEITEEDYKRLEQKAKGFSDSDYEYMLLGEGFYRRLLRFDGMLLHSSAIEYGGKAYLFSANSGVGKSTHTHLWLKYFNNTRIINDDKPAVRLINGEYIAYGTPFSGKTAETVNVGLPIGAIVFIERAKENRIRKLSSAEALPLIFGQTMRPTVSKEHMVILLKFLDGMLSKVPVYKLYCDISREAAVTSFEALTGEKAPEEENENEN